VADECLLAVPPCTPFVLSVSSIAFLQPDAVIDVAFQLMLSRRWCVLWSMLRSQPHCDPCGQLGSASGTRTYS
jgi:hypothetical protein